MNDIESLITLAIRYCIENDKFWSEQHINERKRKRFPWSHYTKSDSNLFPRYFAISKIQLGIETLVGEHFNTIEHCKKELIRRGLNYQAANTKNLKNSIEKAVIQAERKRFKYFIEEISYDHLSKVEPMPYRRKLSNKESKRVRKAIEKIWNFNGIYWVPLVNIDKATIYLDKNNISNKDYADIYSFIMSITQDRLLMLTEEHNDYEIDKSEFNPDCYETFYFDNSFSWIIYGSHENTLAFGGELLIKKILDLYKSKYELINKMESY